MADANEDMDFFSKINIQLLSNVASSTFPPELPFERSDNHYKELQKCMRVVHSENSHLPVETMNKQVLLLLYKTFTQQEQNIPQVDAPTTFPGSSRRDTSHSQIDYSGGIRDLEAHSRPMPTQFHERPQHTTLQSHDENRLPQNENRGELLNTRLQAYELQRSNDTPKDILKPISFKDTNFEDSSLNVDEAIKRMDELLAQRQSLETINVQDGDQESSKDLQKGMADAIGVFDQHVATATNKIDAEQKRQSNSKENQERIFRDKQIYEPKDESENKNNATAEETIESELDQSLSITRLTETDKLRDEYIKQDTIMMDQCKFQEALKLTREEKVLNAQKRFTQSNLLHEHLLIREPKEYSHESYNLEIRSIDRVRSLNHTDTPYDFTVYFGSNRSAWKTYFVWADDPIDYVGEHPITAEIRRSLGLRGIPLYPANFSEELGDLCEYVTVQLPDASPLNVDMVFKNVVQLQVNCVQLYFSTKIGCFQYPFLLLEIKDYCDVYKSTNNVIRKSFCKLYYDASNDPDPYKSLHHEFLPKYGNSQTFHTPLASIDRLSFRILKPNGELFSVAQDSYALKAIEIPLCYEDVETTDGENHFICITLQNHYEQNTLNVKDHVRFEQIEWYKNDWWYEWIQSDGVQKQRAAYSKIETDFLQNMEEANTASEKLKLRSQFAKDQIRFDYPTTGYNNSYTNDLQNIRDYLERDSGHEIRKVSAGEHSDATTIHNIYIDLPRQLDPESGHYQYDPSFIQCAELLNSLQLMNGILLQDSHSTTISLTVIERNAQMVVDAANI